MSTLTEEKEGGKKHKESMYGAEHITCPCFLIFGLCWTSLLLFTHHDV